MTVAACGGRDGDMKRGQQQYDVVEEGSASGVSSTINPLNEQPLTNTAVDTTTNFTLPNTLPPVTTAEAGNIAGTFPTSPPPVYRTPSRPAPPPPPAEPEPMASSSTPTDTTAQNTNTGAPAPAPEPATNTEGENKEPPPPPPPPPPATATDTGGQ